ncbi:MAG: threonine/serine exporter family protein [Pseudomonadota bacterium]
MREPLPLNVRFVRLMAQRLHEYGAGSHRLEGAVKSVASRLGLEVEVFSTPTSMFLTFRESGAPQDDELLPTQLLRLNPGVDDLGRLSEVDAVAEAVAGGELDLASGAQRLLDVRDEPLPPAGLQLLAWSAVGLTVAALLGGTWVDLGLAALLAVATGAFSLRAQRLTELGSFEPLAAFGVTVLAHLLALWLGGTHVAHVVVGALIVLMPGLGLTMAITELSTGHLASGTARFAGATVVLVKLALGVVMATQLMAALGVEQPLAGLPATPPAAFTWPCIVLVGLAFGVLFNARKRDFPAMVLAGIVAYGVNVAAGAALGPDVGVFLAAFAAASASNLYSRIWRRPASIMRLPGVILLVPGSLGYRALTLMFSHNVNDGLTAAVAVITVLGALVGGLLLGNTLVPPRRHL